MTKGNKTSSSESMKPTTNDGNAGDPKPTVLRKPIITHHGKGVKKKLLYCSLPSPMLDDSSKSIPRLLRNRLTTLMLFEECRQQRASIQDNYNGVSPACKTNTHNYDVPQDDPTIEFPNCLYITYCQRCQSYSHTGRKRWFKVPSGSPLMTEFLISRINFYMHIRKLKLLSAGVSTPDSAQNSMPSVVLSLLLEYQAPSGERYKKTCEVKYLIGDETCFECSQLIEESRMTSVLELRRYGSHSRTLRLLQQRILSKQRRAFHIQMIRYKEDGVDYFFTNDADATALSYFLTTEAPVKVEHTSKPIPSPGGSSDGGSSTAVNFRSVISAVVCPIFQNDLVYLPLMVLNTLGLQHMGPLVVCTSVSSKIHLVNPLSLNQCVINSDEYWRNPFEPLRSVRDLVEYRVFDVQIVSSEGLYVLADVVVARDSDFGKNDVTMMVRTHLGHALKPGDRALGYDLRGLQIAGVETEKFQHLLPDAVLVKKRYAVINRLRLKLRKQRSPEYAQFLKDLDSNPEALFNLSLSGGDGEKQNSETFPEKKPENFEHELEDLLADLDLNDQENTDVLKKL